MADEDEWLAPIIQGIGAHLVGALPTNWKSARLILRLPHEDQLSHEIVGPPGATEFVFVGPGLAEFTHRLRDECSMRGSPWKKAEVAVERVGDDWHMKLDFSQNEKSA